MNEIINEKLIVKSSQIKTKKDLFILIANTLKKQNLINNEQKLIADLTAREKLGSTAFENGLVIPHTRTSTIKETKLVIVEFNEVDFQALDNHLSNFAVAIIVPETKATEHLQILSKLSSLFSTKEKLIAFKKLTTKAKVEQINLLSVAKQEKVVTNNDKYDFVAVTSCAAGIAHTYMARDALLEGAKKLHLKAKIETRGAITENKLSAQEIDQAKYVIIAADVAISKKPFLGKKIHEVSTNEAIKDSKKVISDAQNASVVYGKGEKIGKMQIGTTAKKNKLGKAIMSALSFMIPITIVGGILMAIPNALAAGGNAAGGTWKFPNDFSEALWNFGHIGLLMMVPILAMFLAYRIGGKAAMPAALIGGFFINDGALMAKFSLIDLPDKLGGSASAGFLGGLVVGIMVGYLVKYMRWIKWHRWIAPISSLMLVPLISSFLTFIIVLYVIGSPMTWIMAELYTGLSKLDNAGIGASIGIGILFAALMAIDLGGPINKTALVVATAIFTDTLSQGNPNFVAQTAVQAAISVPPLGMWLATIIFRKKFSITEVSAGQAALPMGLVGITEGALPFAFKNPIKAISANVAGAMVAGALVSIFKIDFYGGLGSPLGAYVGYAENTFYGLAWIISIIAGALTTALIFGLLRQRVPAYELQLKEIKLAKKNEYQKMGYETKGQIFKYNVHKILKNMPKKFKYGINCKNWFQKPNDWDEEDEL